MITIPASEYKGYSIVVNAIPAPGNRYYGMFAIYRYGANISSKNEAVLYEARARTDFMREAAAEAHDDAMINARIWIDAKTN